MAKEKYFLVEANNVNYDIGLSGPFSFDEAQKKINERFNEILNTDDTDIEAIAFINENSFRVAFENDDIYYGYIKKIIEGEDDE